jgi:hypothetical protein
MEELEGSPRESVRNDALLVVRDFKVPFTDRLTVWAQGLLVASTAAGSICQIRKPMSYTHSVSGNGSNSVRVRAYEVALRPFGDAVRTGTGPGLETWGAYSWARATVTYRNQESIVEELQLGAEYAALSTAGLYWNTGSGQPPALMEKEAPGLLMHQAIWSVTRRWLPLVPPEYLNLVGTLNVASVSSTRYGLSFGAGTLLYQAPVIHSYSDRFGNSLHDVTARLLYRPNGWNRFWLARACQWVGLMRRDSGAGTYLDASPYPTASDAASFGVLCQYQAQDL